MNARPVRVLLAALITAGIVLGPVVFVPLLSGVVDSAVAATESADLPVQVTVTAVSPQVLRPGEDLVLRATIRNTGADDLADPRVTVRISRFLLSIRTALDQWEQAEPTEPAGTKVQTVTLGAPLPAAAQADVEVRVPATALRLSPAAAAWGPRGLSLEVTDAGRREGLDRTFALWFPIDAETAAQVTPARVSVAVPITSAAVDPTATAADDGATRQALARLDGVVRATTDLPAVAWAVDPALLAALATDAAGATRSADAASTPRLDALVAAATGRDVFALGSFDPDLAALAHAGAGAGELATAAVSLSTAAPLPVLGTPARTDLAWPADPIPDDATVELAAAAGARAVVVGGDGLEAGDLNYTPTGRATVPTPSGDVAALVADPILTDLLADPDGASAASAAQRMLAETAVIARERPSEPRHVLIAPGRGWEPDVTVARAQLGALATAPWLALSPVTTLIGTPDPGVERASLPARDTVRAELRPASVDALRTARSELTTFATITADPAVLVAGADATVLAPLSVAWRAETRERDEVVGQVVAGLTARRAGVGVTIGSVPFVISQSGTFPVALRNDLDQAVTVRLGLVPENRALVVDETEAVTVPAGSQTQARIPFTAVGSGDVQVEVTLLTPDGAPISRPIPFTVRVRADWENVGTVVIAGILGLAFVIGIARTIRRGQTAKRGASASQLAEIAGDAPARDRL